VARASAVVTAMLSAHRAAGTWTRAVDKYVVLTEFARRKFVDGGLPTGKIVVDYLRKNMPAYVDTGLNVVDARDVAAGHLAAAERGQAGERYILGSENLTLRQIFEKLEGISGVPAPKVQIQYAVAYAAGVVTTAWANVSGSEPRAPLDAVKMARKKMWVRHDKAAAGLGYAPGPAVGALRRAVEWFRANGYV